jgi:methionyl aminopeptidase
MMLRAARIETKSEREIALIRRACGIVVEALRALRAAAVDGVSTAELDRLAASEIRRLGAKPAFLGYRGYPASLCVSIDSEVVHGIPRPDRRLRNGQIVSFDLGAVAEGYYGDAALTVPVGEVPGPALRLMDVAFECLGRGVVAARGGGRVGDIGAAIQRHAEALGCSPVRDFVGHGIGRALHEDPPVPNFGQEGTGLRLCPGMVLAIEPMINAGGSAVRVLEDGWTAVTADGSLSAHFEHTVALTEGGCRILTEGLNEP